MNRVWIFWATGYSIPLTDLWRTSVGNPTPDPRTAAPRHSAGNGPRQLASYQARGRATTSHNIRYRALYCNRHFFRSHVNRTPIPEHRAAGRSGRSSCSGHPVMYDAPGGVGPPRGLLSGLALCQGHPVQSSRPPGGASHPAPRRLVRRRPADAGGPGGQRGTVPRCLHATCAAAGQHRRGQQREEWAQRADAGEQHALGRPWPQHSRSNWAPYFPFALRDRLPRCCPRRRPAVS